MKKMWAIYSFQKAKNIICQLLGMGAILLRRRPKLLKVQKMAIVQRSFFILTVGKGQKNSQRVSCWIGMEPGKNP